MRTTFALTLAVSTAAFVPSHPAAARSSMQVDAAIDDLKTIAEKSNPVLKFVDPLQLSAITIWGESEDASIAFLRHSEIKHGRIAMAAFVGYIVHANGIHFPWVAAPLSDSPPEIWDAIPEAAKWQIILFVGFLEMYSEMTGMHYMRGGQPGKYPSFKDGKIPHPVPLDFFDPFGLSKNKSAAAKERGLISELNNGRLAMFGILGFLAEQKVEGSVPLLTQIGTFAHYDGEVMAPFA